MNTFSYTRPPDNHWMHHKEREEWEKDITKGLGQIEKEDKLTTKALCKKIQRETQARAAQTDRKRALLTIAYPDANCVLVGGMLVISSPSKSMQLKDWWYIQLGMERSN